MTQAGNTGSDPSWNETNPTWNDTVGNATEPLYSGDIEKILFDPAIDSVGEGVFAMFICGIVILPLYARTEDPTLPAITLALFSGMAIPVLPGMLVGVAWGVLWIASTVALFGLVQLLR